MSRSRDTTEADLQGFAAAVAHEIRTPLSAVAGELELALRRDRSPEEYREVLRRIAAGVDELVQISGDLALFGDPASRSIPEAAVAPLDGVLVRIRERYSKRDDVEIAMDPSTAVRVAAEEDRLLRALVLIIEHALRHRKGAGVVSLRAVPLADHRVRLLVEALPSGFWPQAWKALADSPDGVAGPLRLRTAQRLLEGAGGRLHVAHDLGTVEVRVDLDPIP